MNRRLRIIEVLPSHSASAAAAALLFLSACATGGAQAPGEMASLREEVRTLQRENAELSSRVESMATQVDLLSVRLARAEGARPASDRPAAPAATAPAAATSSKASVAGEPAPLVPSNLKVVKLEAPAAAPTSKGAAAKPVKVSAGAKTSAAPEVPTSTPIQEPTPAALAALSQGSRQAPADVKTAFDRARALSGLTRARAMEQVADDFPASPRAAEALVDAARTRRGAGDPDGSCEDFTRVVAEYPASRSMPDALEGLAACEQRRGRTAEASRLLARLAKDYPESPAGKRASEHAPAAQGAAP